MIRTISRSSAAATAVRCVSASSSASSSSSSSSSRAAGGTLCGCSAGSSISASLGRLSLGSAAPFSTSAPARAAAAAAAAGGEQDGQTKAQQPVRIVNIPAPRPKVTDPKSFLQAISRGPRRVLHENTAALTALGESWEEMWGKVLDGQPREGSSATSASAASASTPNTAASPRAGKQINKALRANGVPVKDRRYILWALEKYRQGLDPQHYAIKVKAKKKIRGWGPRVQNGIRVRGRRRPGEK
ncbi:hypothetical protein OC835_002487 [Tilletia horrida]|nr:hypothetical protein OC835_002487 [Tilletia horrida]